MLGMSESTVGRGGGIAKSFCGGCSLIKTAVRDIVSELAYRSFPANNNNGFSTLALPVPAATTDRPRYTCVVKLELT